MDQYSLLHFATGIIAYFWNIPFLLAFALHFTFEIVENTQYGMYIINKYIIEPGYFSWPGEKHYADNIMNITGDNLAFVLGFIISYLLDIWAVKHKYFAKTQQ